MPEVLHDLSLRNIAGAVCYTIASEAFGVPGVHPDHDHGLLALSRRHAEAYNYPPPLRQMSEKASRQMRPLIDVIAGATIIAANLTDLPDPDYTTGVEWMRLFNSAVWIDCLSRKQQSADGKTCRFSLLAFEGETMGWTGAPDGIAGAAIARWIYVLTFWHLSDRSSLVLNGNRFTAGFDSGLIAFGVPKKAGDDFKYGLSDFNGIKLTGDELWPDYASLLGSLENAVARLMKVLFAVNMLSNVRLQKVAPARKIPKYEQKYPRLDYHVLTLKRDRGAISPKLKEQLRQSPRQHLRRGHLRRLIAPKFTKPYTWIPPCIVGDAGRGSIVKDYLL